MSYAVARIKRGEARALKAGGLWIYDNEIAGVDGSFENGDIVAVEDFDGYFLGYGFINMNSKIRIRVLSRKKEHEITESFMEQRVRDCWEYRKTVVAKWFAPAAVAVAVLAVGILAAVKIRTKRKTGSWRGRRNDP